MEYLQTQGISLPRLGLGTFRMQGDACRAAVESALTLGYRHIDTAEMYGNEEAVGAAIASSRLARGDLHVTTEVWNENLAPDAIRRSFEASLKKLRLDQVDLYLVHWPATACRPPRTPSPSPSRTSQRRTSILLMAWRHGLPYARGQSGNTARGRECWCSGKRTRFHLC